MILFNIICYFSVHDLTSYADIVTVCKLKGPGHGDFYVLGSKQRLN